MHDCCRRGGGEGHPRLWRPPHAQSAVRRLGGHRLRRPRSAISRPIGSAHIHAAPKCAHMWRATPAPPHPERGGPVPLEKEQQTARHTAPTGCPMLSAGGRCPRKGGRRRSERRKRRERMRETSCWERSGVSSTGRPHRDLLELTPWRLPSVTCARLPKARRRSAPGGQAVGAMRREGRLTPPRARRPATARTSRRARGRAARAPGSTPTPRRAC